MIVGDALTKMVDGSRHLLKNPPAIAIDADAIAQAEAAGVSRVVITDRESADVYRATLQELHGSAGRLTGASGGRSRCASRWRTDCDQAPAPASGPDRPAQPVAVQLALFGA